MKMTDNTAQLKPLEIEKFESFLVHFMLILFQTNLFLIKSYASYTRSSEHPNPTASIRIMHGHMQATMQVMQFFEYQESTKDQKLILASFHLEGEANQWWQWLRRSYQEERRVVTWEIFMEELWARFEPTDCEDFDEALSRVKQTDTLRDYQKEFKRLGNRVQGWTQKALVGTFMGGLKPEISEEIRLFKPRTLKEAINLARMRDEQLQRQKRLMRPPIFSRSPPPQNFNNRASPAIPFKKTFLGGDAKTKGARFLFQL